MKTYPLSRRLALEVRAAASDGAGGEDGEWAPLGIHNAYIETLGARENMTGAQSGARVTHRAIIRYCVFGSPGRPRPDQRFREGDRIFNIRGVAEADSFRKWLICWLEEGAVS